MYQLRMVRMLLLLLAFIPGWAPAQDSVRTLQEVTVKAFAYNRKAEQVPASVAIITPSDFNRFAGTSLLPAVNNIPSVRMEERSPGSYRFSIRGSTLRSPFGVRNVKFYWNGLPLTDGGGNTYLNLVDLQAVGSMEVLKGPSGSLYGAGTGGVVLLQPAIESSRNWKFGVTGGSYGLWRTNASGLIASGKNFKLSTRLAYQSADGYRQQTRMSRFAATIDLQHDISAQTTLTGSLLISKLYYQTPGGLTLAQYQQDPSQARPGAGPLPGSVEQQASVDNTTGYLNLNLQHEWNTNWSTRAGVFGSLTRFVNPTLRNFEIRDERNAGFRTDTEYLFRPGALKGKISMGLEYQHFYSPVTDYDNNQGTKGSVQTSDLLSSDLATLLTQADIDLPHKLFLSIGGSLNYVTYGYERTSVSPEVSQERSFNPVFSPRLAILKGLTPNLSVFASVSRGFSPPSLAEVRPSTTTFNNTLQAEQGYSYEAGLKGNIGRSLQFTIDAYDFRLQNAIVIQRDANGADFFVNAGATVQRGAEVWLSWHNTNTSNTQWKAWVSYAYCDYHFSDYVSAGSDYSGNALTGVAPTVFSLGGDVKGRSGWYANLTLQYSDRLPLNDGNTEYADQYFLVGSRVGKVFGTLDKWSACAGVDNALDQLYTPGADINAAGGRYYNAGLRRNVYAGISLRLVKD